MFLEILLEKAEHIYIISINVYVKNSFGIRFIPGNAARKAAEHTFRVLKI